MKKGTANRKRSERWWREVIAKQAESGESVAVVCKRRGISPWSFYAWRKRLGAKPSFSSLEIGLVNECEVRCRNGRCVVVRGAASPSVLANILLAAEGRHDDAAK